MNSLRWSLAGMSAIDQRVAIEQLTQLWQVGPWSVPGQLAGLIAILQIIHQSVLPWPYWGAPVALLLSVWAVSGVWLLRIRRGGIGTANFAYWRRRTLWREGAQSFGWGWLGAVLWGGLTSQWHTLLLVGIVLFCFVSLLFCIQDFGLAITASSPVTLIMVGRLAVAGHEALWYLILLLLAAYLTCLGAGRAISQRLVEGARLRHRTAELAQQLAAEVSNAQTAQQRAEQANQDKSAFLTAASHDLRQPLHTLTLLSGLLDSAAALPEAQRIGQRMQAALEGLRFVFDQLFDVAHLDAGRIPHQPQALAIDRLLHSLHQEYSAAFEAKGLAWILDAPRCRAVADPLFVQRILRNLLDNALRYTLNGQVRLRTRTRDGQVRVQVWDSGPGIPRAMRQRIFDDFVQGHNARRQRSEGLGLGLSVVRRLVEQGGYQLRLLSDEGRATCFELRLPHCAAPASPGTGDEKPPVAPHATASRPLLLLIDDDPEALAALQDTLEANGWPCLPANDGEAAIMAVSRTGRWPGGIVCDFRLSDARAQDQTTGNGLDCIAQLRHEFGLHLPAWLLTGDQQPSLHAQCQAQSVTLLHKPISCVSLIQALTLIDTQRAA